ncbi:MAG: adenosylcobinamide-GDP ribazoletransferase [Actinomycetota bacterium]
MHSFLGAIQFLTRVPVRLSRPADTAACVPWFPTVGAIVGGVAGLVYVALSELVAPGPSAAIAVLLGVGLTGAFHEDGLADSADAMGGWTVEQRRTILKDSRHGTYGVAALCGSIVARILTLATLGPAVGVAGLVAAHSIGRSAAVGAMAGSGPAASPEGLGAEYTRGLGRGAALVGVATGIGWGALATGWWVGPIVGVVVVVTVPLAAWLRRAFGGVVGDGLGATEQIAEIATLLTVSALATRHALWWT